MLLKIHPKVEETLRNPDHGTVIDGAFATQAYDTSAEIINIQGMDISSLNDDAVLNSEHLNPDNKQFVDKGKEEDGQWGTIVGRIIFAKKIFGPDDCESERELHLWEMLQIPFIYGAGELFDAEGHENAKACAAIIKHYHKRNLPVVIRYSIEGSTVKRNGPHLLECLARRVAMTIKPCNKSAISNLVEEAANPHQLEITKSEEGIQKYISVFEMEYDPHIESPLESLKLALEQFKDLNKTFTLGSSDAAPSTLTGGAALAKEDVSKKSYLKSQVLAALRDWDGIKSFKTFLKHRLPDANEEVLDKFAEVAKEVKIKKAQLEQNSLQKKDIPDDYGAKPLSQLNTEIPAGAKVFKDKYVMPGEVELTAGPYQGSKLKLLHVDKTHAYVQPLKAGDQQEVKINKLNRNTEGSHFRIIKPPEDLKVSNYVHGDKHTDLGLTESHEQKELAHGIDMASDPVVQPHQHGSTEARTNGVIGWFRAANGKLGYVKPAVTYPQDDLKPKDPHYLSTARRETIFHNVAKNFFGLGEHVPTTTLFKHPQSGHDHSVMELIPHATHMKLKHRDHELHDRLLQAGDTGQLDKMAVMDHVMGNMDRNRLNYMTSPNHPHIHLIDNALIFQNSDSDIPSYLTDYHHLKGQPLEDAQMHPEAVKWLVSLDPFQLGAELTRQGVHPKLANQAVARLLSAQSAAVLGNTKKNSILFAHSKYQEGQKHG